MGAISSSGGGTTSTSTMRSPQAEENKRLHKMCDHLDAIWESVNISRGSNNINNDNTKNAIGYNTTIG